MTTPNKDQVTSMLTSLKNELKKEYIERDGSNRITAVYQAPRHTENGGFCLVTTLTYENATTTEVQKSREDIGTWVSATMDI